MSAMAALTPSNAARGGLRLWTGALWTAATFALLAIAWVLATDVLHLVPERIFPSPTAVVAQFASLLTHPFAGTTLFGHAAASLNRWMLGVLVAVAIGVPLGFLLAWIPVLRSIVAPIFELLRYIPPFAWIPIAVVWMGANTFAQAFVVFIAAFPPIVINSRLGVTQVDALLLRAARVLGAGSWTTLFRVVTPIAGSAAFTGVRIGFGNGWMALVGAELIVGDQGLGNLIVRGQENQSTPTILVGMISIAVIATAFDHVLQRLQHAAFPWSRNPRA